MDVRIGTDVVELNRFKSKLNSSPAILKSLFTTSELKKSDSTHLAGVFAAKEAVIKALELPPGSWLKTEIGYQGNGKPILKLPKKLETNLESHDLSITHDGEYVVATFVALVK
jgi:phosphopantetheine--protein transferase-like protein